MLATAAQMAAALGLEPHVEGGFFLETYRAPQTLQTPCGERATATAIFFLVTAESVSRLHRLASDELWIHQGGLPLELVSITGDGELQRRVLGDLRGRVGSDRDGIVHGGAPVSSAAELRAGPTERAPDRLLQAVVPAGSWQGARVVGATDVPADRAWSLVVCVVTPGFDYADFEIGGRDELLALCPQHAELICALT